MPHIPSNSSFLSPLRYPGGKGRLGPWFASLMHFNGLSGGCYVEPFAGGAGVGLFLLLNGHANRIILNDKDPAISTFWKVAVHHTQDLIDEVNKHAPTMQTRALAQRILSNPSEFNDAELAFSALFVNRTSRSGILKAGVVGGKAQTGKYKLDERYSKADIIRRLQLIGNHRSQIEVHHQDAVAFLQSISPTLPQKSVVFLDPPYYVKGSLLYRDFYVHKDHLEMAQTLQNLSHPVVVTYDTAPEICQMYAHMKSAHFSLTYSTGLDRPKASEVLFYSHLQLPSPPMITRAQSLPH